MYIYNNYLTKNIYNLPKSFCLEEIEHFLLGRTLQTEKPFIIRRSRINFLSSFASYSCVVVFSQRSFVARDYLPVDL